MILDSSAFDDFGEVLGDLLVPVAVMDLFLLLLSLYFSVGGASDGLNSLSLLASL